MSETAKKTGDTGDGKITQEDIDRARAQIGVPIPSRGGTGGGHDPVPTAAGIEHFSFSYGDDNPLWNDPDYARNTRWGDIIAPPTYHSITGKSAAPVFTPETKKLFRGLFKGVGAYLSGYDYEWWKPIYVSDEILKDRCVTKIDVHENSKFSGDVSVTDTTRNLALNRLGEPVASVEVSFAHAERDATRKTDKHKDVKRQTYTPEDIAEIDAIYAAEEIRGATPRYWEDVQIGDQLQPLAKGPMSMVDLISTHIGRGMSGTSGAGPLRLWWKTRQRMPGFFAEDAYGVPDIVQRMHWNDEWAQSVGLPIAYDYGEMRINWLAHLVANWIGDDGWLWKMHAELRKFNFMGDWHKMEGEVVDKRREGHHCIVDLAIKGTSQRGWITCPGSATVILPSREHGPVMLPTAPDPIRQRGLDVIVAAAERKRTEGNG